MGRVLACSARLLLVILTRSACCSWICGKALYRLARRLIRRRSATFGSARFASGFELMRRGVLKGDGLNQLTFALHLPSALIPDIERTSSGRDLEEALDAWLAEEFDNDDEEMGR
ncbi:MAG: hypothetical protein ABL908_13545 [Hyphomicrobium sp.]